MWDELSGTVRPQAFEASMREAQALGFAMSSDLRTGILLRTLVASKPGGTILELGTGAGVGTSWLLDGMSSDARLFTVEDDSVLLDKARTSLGHDSRVEFILGDAGDFLNSFPPSRFDLIFADTWAGKFSHVAAALSAVALGGYYVIDDLLPQPTWPENHASNVESLMNTLESRTDFVMTKLLWSTGLVVMTKRA